MWLLLLPLFLHLHLDPAWIALIGTIFGGLGLKLTEKWLGRHTDAIPIRSQLWQEVKDLNERIDKLEEQILFWRGRYYEEQERNAVLRIQLVQHGIAPVDHLQEVKPPVELTDKDKKIPRKPK